MRGSRVAVVGTGLITAGGDTVAQTWDSLLAKKDTSSQRVCFDTSRTVHTVGLGTDLFSLAGFAIKEVLDSGGFSVDRGDGIDTLCVGSSSDTVAERELGHLPHGGRMVSDRLAGVLNIEHHYQFANACASSSYAIATAMDLIRLGHSRFALAGGVDEVTLSSMAGFASWRIYGDRCRPFAAGRHGLVLADAAAFLLLTQPDLIGWPAIAYLTGAGLAADGVSVAAMTMEGVLSAMEAALDEAGSPTIDAVFAHGTGTENNDEVESKAIAELWGDHLPKVVSYKGVLGHPQGASGAVGTVLAVEAVHRQQLFGTVAFDDVDPDLAVAGVVTKTAGPADLKNIMVLSHGTWGVYSALIVSAVE